MTKTSDMDRRTLLRGVGGLAIALPWLEIMGDRPKAFAQSGGLAKKFIAVYTPGGTVREKWRCTGTETNFQLSPILSPLQKVKDKVIFLRNVALKSARGEQHQAGIVSLLTGTGQSGSHSNYASGPSIDQVILKRASAGQAKKSLEIAVRWATGNSQGKLHPINSMNFDDNASFSPIPPRLDPQQIWNDLFGQSGMVDHQVNVRKKSILDFVDKSYVGLSAKLGSRDKQVLEQHLTKIREMEGLLQNGMVAGMCAQVERVNTSGYNPTAELSNGAKTATDEAIPLVGKFMMDMIVTALSCDITSVATLQWTDTEAKHTFPWLGLNQHHHYYQHDGGYKPAELELIYTWYAKQHAYLLERLDAIAMPGGRTLLDDSVVLFGSELGHPADHSKNDMPLLLAGRGGGLRSGRLVTYNDESHNDLLVTILRLFGENREKFGNPEFCKGPLGNLV
jgi:hypothetical protein